MIRKILKRYVSYRKRQNLALKLVRARMPTARWRPLPNLLVIGTQRGGTSSLFKYLASHPRCGPSVRKEVRYFSEYYHNGPLWYRSHFPISGRLSKPTVIFEATPDYLFDPRVPKRASALLPQLKIIVLLRNPIERAYSQYWHNRIHGTEWLSFESALDSERERTATYMSALEHGSLESAHKSLLRYSYVERGRYSKQLSRWLDFVDAKQVLVVVSEMFYKKTDNTYQSILEFLGLPAWRPAVYKNFSYPGERPSFPPMAPESRRRLEREFASEFDSLKETWQRDVELFNYWTESESE